MSRIRGMLLALVLFGSVGLLLELLLLEHFGSPFQLIPLTLLSLAILAGGAVAVRPRPATVRAFQGVMVALLIASVLGLWFHMRENAAFEREIDESIEGLTLVWLALRGATPSLAPGALAQIGILGLILAYRHPALRERRGGGSPSTSAAE